MANTVVSIFPNPQQAAQAREQLLATGFSADQIDVKIASYKSDEQAPEKQDEDVDVIERITAFFKDLFGPDDDEVTHYTQAGRKGTIVTVHTDTNDEAEKVAAFFDSFGALDVAETSGSYFPEKEPTATRHQFLDDPTHVFNEDHKITTRLKSRIVARSVEKAGGRLDG